MLTTKAGIEEWLDQLGITASHSKRKEVFACMLLRIIEHEREYAAMMVRLETATDTEAAEIQRDHAEWYSNFNKQLDLNFLEFSNPPSASSH